MAFTASVRFLTSVCSRRLLCAALVGVSAGMGVLGGGGCQSGASRSALPAPELRAERNPVDREAYAALGYRLQWRGFAVMGAYRGVEHVSLIGDGLALLTRDSLLTYIDTETGASRWHDQPASPLTRFVGFAESGSKMIVAAESEVFIYDVSSSNLEDRQRLDAVISTPPIAAGDYLVCGTPSGEIYGHYLPTGFRAWGNALTGAIEVAPREISGAVAVTSATGQVIVLDPRSGVSIGRNGDPLDGSSVGLGTSASAVFLASRDQSLYGISADGRRLWRVRTEAPLAWAPTHHAGRVYCTLPGRGLTSVDASSGEVQWANGDVEGEVVAVRRERLICWDRENGRAFVIDMASGDVLESVSLPHVDHLIFDGFEDGDMYIVSPLGVVSKFVPRS